MSAGKAKADFAVTQDAVCSKQPSGHGGSWKELCFSDAVWHDPWIKLAALSYLGTHRLQIRDVKLELFFFLPRMVRNPNRSTDIGPFAFVGIHHIPSYFESTKS